MCSSYGTDSGTPYFSMEYWISAPNSKYIECWSLSLGENDQQFVNICNVMFNSNPNMGPWRLSSLCALRLPCSGPIHRSRAPPLVHLPLPTPGRLDCSPQGPLCGPPLPPGFLRGPPTPRQVLLLARIGSPRPLDSLPLVSSCRLPLVLALAHCWSSLHPDLGPHYGMFLDLTTTWLYSLVCPFSGPDYTLILVLCPDIFPFSSWHCFSLCADIDLTTSWLSLL